MSREEKVIGLGALLLLIGSFMPWHSVVLNFGGVETLSNAFSGDIGVVGFVVLLMTLVALLYLMAENLHLRLPQFGYKKSQLLFFLMGESFFLVLLTLAIYTKRSLGYTQAGLRFGIYISLVGAFLAAFAAFAKVRKAKGKEEKAALWEEEDFPSSQAHEDPKREPQPMYFGEDREGPILSPAFQASEPQTSTPSSSSEANVHNHSKPQDPNPSTDQAGFFSRQAGLKR